MIKRIGKYLEVLSKYELICLFFYHFIFRSNLLINIINYLSGRNIHNLAIQISNVLAGARLRKLSQKTNQIERVIELTKIYSFSPHNIPHLFKHDVRSYLIQKNFEIIEFIKLFQQTKPQRILEIGTALGGTLFLFSRFSEDRALIISIDLPDPGGPYGGGYFEYRIPFLKSFCKRKQKIVLLRMDSHETRTFDYIKKVLDNQKLDLLFIDGDHSYEGVKKDFEMYYPLVKHGGLVCFHDIVPGEKIHVGGAPDFWKEISNQYQTREIVDNWNQGGFGIGIIFKK